MSDRDDIQLTKGDHQARMEFAYAGPALGKGGVPSLYVDGKKVGEGTIAATAPAVRDDHLVEPEEAVPIATATQ
jgi:hypothetical protein